MLHNPAEAELAHAIGMIGNHARHKLYGVAEGLSVAVFDARAFGGQAGASARIENHLGFPTGISGEALAGRAFNQALKFGAEMMIPVSVTSLDCSNASGGLGASMSRYLIDRIEAAADIELMFNTDVVAVEGPEDSSLERVRWRSRFAPDDVHSLDLRNLFLFVGADPATGWLSGCGVTLDRGGFVVTGAQSEQNHGRPVPPLETSVRGL